MLQTHLLTVTTAMAALALAAPPATGQGIRIRELWATKGSPATVEFGVITGMAEAPSGEVWISDGINNVVAAASADGKRLRVVARKGNGPGEVQGPSLMASLPSGGMAVYDVIHNAVELFGSDSRFQKRVTLERKVINPKGFAVHPDGGFVISGGVYGERDAIHLFSPEGKVRRSWHPIPRTRGVRAGVMVAGGPVQALSDGSVLFSQAAPHRILVYRESEPEGRTIAVHPSILPAIGDDFIVEEDGQRTFRWWFPQSRGIFRLENGNVLNVIRFRDDGFGIWEIYSPGGRLLARSKVSRAYEPWALTRDGHVLASYLDPDTHESVAVRLAVEVVARRR